MSGCRDCPACTRSPIVRWCLLYPMLVPLLAALCVRPFVKCCRGCPHVLWRHQRRSDGSFID